MKIKSLHIDGFGALVNYSLNFNDELNSYFLNNGEGKTTIICFIKSMLFGLDKSNKKIDDRKLYFPKFASAFGGTLDIEIDNKIYHIRRTFDKKSVSKDVLECTIDDKEINYEEVLKNIIINKNAYEKIISIDLNDIHEMVSSDDVQDYLNGKVLQVDDVNISQTVDNVEKLKKSITDTYLKSLNSQIKEKEFQINQKEAILKSLSIYIEKDKQFKAKREEIEKRKKEYDQYKIREANNASYLNAKKEKEELEKEAKELLEKNNNYFPSDEQFKQYEKTLKDYVFDVKQLEVPYSQKELLEKYELKFAKKTPSEEELENVASLISDYDKNKAKIESTKIDLEKIKNDPKINRFLEFKAKEKEIQLDELYKQYQSLKDKKEIKSVSSHNISKLNIAGIALSIVFLIASIISFIVIPAPINYIVGSLSAFFFAVSLVLIFFKPVDKDLKNVDSELTLINKKLINLLAYFGYEQEVEYSYNDFKINVKALDEYLAKKTELEKEINTLCLTVQENENKLNKFFVSYNISGNNYHQDIEVLKSELNQYLSLKKNYQQYLDNASNLKNKIKEEKDILLQINKLKDCDDEALSAYYDSTRRDAQKYEQIKKDIAVRDKRLEQYKYVDPSTDIDFLNYSMLNEDEIKADLKDINSKIEENIKQISSIQTEGAMLDDLLEEKENLLKEYNDKKHQKEIIVKTIELLNAAKQKVADDIVKPIVERFTPYNNLLKRVNGDEVKLTETFEISLNRNGASLSLDQLSDGEKTLIGLLLRLSLVDNIFQKEKPFIIFDDLFALLDEDNLTVAKTLLHNLAKEKQIIYFTCHESRKI